MPTAGRLASQSTRKVFAHQDESGTWRVLGEELGVEVATLRPGKHPEGPASPVDVQLASLGKQLNSTFVPFGENGAAAAENQKAQDENVASLGVSVAASRAVTKAGPLYEGDWDLVDAVDGSVAVAVIRETGQVALLPLPQIASAPDAFGLFSVEGTMVGSVALAEASPTAFLYTNAVDNPVLTVFDS